MYRVDGFISKKGEASLRSDRPAMYFPLYVNTQTGEVSIDPPRGLETSISKRFKGN